MGYCSNSGVTIRIKGFISIHKSPFSTINCAIQLHLVLEEDYIRDIPLPVMHENMFEKILQFIYLYIVLSLHEISSVDPNIVIMLS